MKKNKHPELNNVCFKDVSTGKKFLTKGCLRSKDTEVIDGTEYFVIICDVTSDSHPAYTGKDRFVDTAGRIEKFEKKFSRSRRRA